MQAPTDAQLEKFFRPVVVETRLPVVNKEDMKNGVLLRFDGTKAINVRGTVNLLQQWTTRMGDGAPFALWGTAGLNQQLDKVRVGQIVFLSYRGLLPSDDSAAVLVHQWSVNVATVGKDSLPAEWVKALDGNQHALSLAILAAGEREAAEFAKRSAERSAERNNGANPAHGSYADMLETRGGPEA